MKSYHRTKYLDRIKKSLQNEKLLLLYGQRQVGKTTLMNILIEDKTLVGIKKIFSFEDTQKRQFADKQEFIDFLSFELNIDFSQEGFLFLDEVQYVENIIGHLKAIYDDNNYRIKIIATGSGMRNIPTVGWSTLVGRWDEIYIYPFSFEEFLGIKWKNIDFLKQEKYSTLIWEKLKNLYQEYLVWWGYPEVIKATTDEAKHKQLQKIVKRFFEKDVAFWFSREDFIEFKKIYFYLFQNIWNLLKNERIADITNIWVKKIKKYLTFLLRSLVIFEVPPFFSDKSKEIFSQANMYLSDMGMLSYLSKNYWNKTHDGKVIENFAFLELKKHFPNSEIKFYKKKNWTEIDFVVESWKWKIIPIEIKSNNNLTTPKIFYNFQKEYGSKISYFIRTTEITIWKKDIEKQEVLFLPNFLLGNIIKEL